MFIKKNVKKIHKIYINIKYINFLKVNYIYVYKTLKIINVKCDLLPKNKKNNFYHKLGKIIDTSLQFIFN